MTTTSTHGGKIPAQEFKAKDNKIIYGRPPLHNLFFNQQRGGTQVRETSTVLGLFAMPETALVPARSFLAFPP